jgi:hypothetical protein
VAVGSIHPSWIDTDLVRDSEAQHPTFATMRSTLPWPANSTSTVDVCADAMVRAIETRARKVHVPKNTKLLATLRPLVLSGLFSRLAERQVRDDLPRLDEENQALGAPWH